MEEFGIFLEIRNMMGIPMLLTDLGQVPFSNTHSQRVRMGLFIHRRHQLEPQRVYHLTSCFPAQNSWFFSWTSNSPGAAWLYEVRRGAEDWNQRWLHTVGDWQRRVA